MQIPSSKMFMVIDALAVGYAPEVVSALAGIPIEFVMGAIEEFQEAIEKRAVQLRDEIGLFSPAARFRMLEKIANLGVDGYTAVGKGGVEILVQNPAVAVQAIRAMNSMQSEMVSQSASASERRIIEGLVNDLRQQNPKATPSQIKKLINDSLPGHDELVGDVVDSFLGELPDEEFSEC